jgi:hypothetical protein
VYQYIIGSWSQIRQDMNGKSAFDLSSQSLSLSSGGNIVPIGSPSNGSDYARVFELVSKSWNQLLLNIDGESASD